MKIAVNGWDLIARPTDADSLFTLEWLNGLASTQPDFNLDLVIPKTALEIPAEKSIDIHELEIGISAAGKIRFEQHHLVRFAAEQGADVLYYPTGGAPLNSPLPVVTLSGFDSKPIDRTFLGRLGWAVRRAGIKGAASRLHIVEPGQETRRDQGRIALPAWVSSLFNPIQLPSDREALQPYSLSPGYVVSYVNHHSCLGRILEVWRWVIDSVDPGQPLVLVGLSGDRSEDARALIDAFELGDWVRITAALSLNELPAIYRQSACYFHGCPTQRGQELRWALATGAPVVGIESPLSSRILREAGYLAAPEDVRGLAAACITVLVEPDVADALRKAGLARAHQFHQDGVFDILAEVLRAARPN